MCRAQAAELRSRLSDIRSLGADLVIVGSGAPMFAHAFIEDEHLEGITVLTDEKLAAYKLFDFRRSVLHTLFAPRRWNVAVRAFREGHRQHRTQGDAWQQGGVIVVRPGGELLYRYASREAGDHPPVDEVLAPLRSAAA